MTIDYFNTPQDCRKHFLSLSGRSDPIDIFDESVLLTCYGNLVNFK